MKYRFITGLGVFLLLAAAASALIWTQVTPMYGARAELQVSRVVPGLVERDRTVPFYDFFVNIQMSIVRSPTVLRRALQREDVRATTWYQDPRISLLERLQDDLAVHYRPQTEVVEVALSDPDPEAAAVLVNAVLDEYNSRSRDPTP